MHDRQCLGPTHVLLVVSGCAEGVSFLTDTGCAGEVPCFMGGVSFLTETGRAQETFLEGT